MASIQAAAGGVVLLGVAALFGAWRGRARGDAGRLGVVAGWGLIGCGLLGWSLSTSPDVGLSLAVMATMAAALVLIAGRGLMLAQILAQAPKPVKPPKPKPDDDRLSLGPGYWVRAGLRGFGGLVAAPAAAVCIGLAWRAFGPGGEADRLIGMTLAAILAMAAALVSLLASRRPGRAVAAILLVGLVALIGALAPQLAPVQA
jgi:hypothetical protein